MLILMKIIKIVAVRRHFRAEISGVARNVNWRGPSIPCPLPLLPFTSPLPSPYFNGGPGVIPPEFVLKLKVLVGEF